MTNNNSNGSRKKIKDIVRDILKDAISKIELINTIPCSDDEEEEEEERMEIEELLVYLDNFIINKKNN